MSLKSHEARKLAVASLAAFAALSAGASSAQAAQTASLDYQCKYPILGTEPLTIDMTLDIPETWPVGVDTPPFAISAVATAGGDTAPGLALIDDLTSIEGVSLASSSVFLPQGGSLKVNVPIVVPNYVVPVPTPDPLVLNASGTTPSLTFDEPGTARITLDKLALNLTARDSFGDPIVLPPVTRDIDGVAVTPSDSDPGTFDVYCKLVAGQAPAGENPTIASFEIIDDVVGPDTEAPSAPTEVDGVISDFGPTSINVRWGASTDNVGVTEYVIRYEGEEVRVPATAGPELEKLITGLGPDSEYLFEISAVDAAGNESDPLVILLVTSLPNAAPSQVSGVTATPALNSVALSWAAATDADGSVAEYNVYNGATKVATVTGTSATVSGLAVDTAYAFQVEAVDNKGLAGAKSAVVNTRTLKPADTTAPTNPTVTATPAQTSVVLNWSGATDNVGVVGYDVFNGTTLVTSVTGTTATVSGLTADTAYTFKVVAKDAAGNKSTGGSVSTRTTGGGTGPAPVKYSYSLKGSTSVKTLSKGTLPLNGGINANLTLATGAFSADLTLADTQGRLTALGFLPVTAKIGFVPSGKTTGTLLDGVLNTKSFIRIKVKEVKLFGAIPLAGGNNCQTKSLSEINLKSTDPEFKPLSGGPIAGTYRISDLNGCGVLNGLVSPLTAGAGNTINAVLTPRPVTF